MVKYRITQMSIVIFFNCTQNYGSFQQGGSCRFFFKSFFCFNAQQLKQLKSKLKLCGPSNPFLKTNVFGICIMCFAEIILKLFFFS